MALTCPRPPFLQGARPLVVAHRGASAHAPANTLPAFELAVASGADALELDVHWTRDGTLVVIHDDTVDATSNGTGRVADLTYRELSHLDFGYRFTTDGGKTFPYRGRGVRLLTLRDVLTRFPHTPVNLEIKPPHPSSLRQLVCEIWECAAEQRVLLASFHHEVLTALRQMGARLATSASPREAAAFLARSACRMRPPRRVPYCALQLPVRHRGLPVIRPTLLAAAAHAGIPVHAWTVNDPREQAALLRLGVKGLVTDDPALAVRVRAECLTQASA
ncbi:MAG: glycerophosphodiester phosphodiesterase [Alicyclobacillus sp.]|nr:glycerophosphodiester phosphodiesterase [Alicyclobacillus sp.]